MFQERYIVNCFYFGITNQVYEPFYRFWCVTSPPQTTERWHSWIIPSSYLTLLNQFEKLSLAHHGIGQIETVELDLPRSVIISFELIDKPIITRTVDFKFKCAQ